MSASVDSSIRYRRSMNTEFIEISGATRTYYELLESDSRSLPIEVPLAPLVAQSRTQSWRMLRFVAVL